MVLCEMDGLLEVIGDPKLLNDYFEESSVTDAQIAEPILNLETLSWGDEFLSNVDNSSVPLLGSTSAATPSSTSEAYRMVSKQRATTVHHVAGVQPQALANAGQPLVLPVISTQVKSHQQAPAILNTSLGQGLANPLISGQQIVIKTANGAEIHYQPVANPSNAATVQQQFQVPVASSIVGSSRGASQSPVPPNRVLTPSQSPASQLNRASPLTQNRSITPNQTGSATIIGRSTTPNNTQMKTTSISPATTGLSMAQLQNLVSSGQIQLPMQTIIQSSTGQTVLQPQTVLQGTGQRNIVFQNASGQNITMGQIVAGNANQQQASAGQNNAIINIFQPNVQGVSTNQVGGVQGTIIQTAQGKSILIPSQPMGAGQTINLPGLQNIQPLQFQTGATVNQAVSSAGTTVIQAPQTIMGGNIIGTNVIGGAVRLQTSSAQDKGASVINPQQQNYVVNQNGQQVLIQRAANAGQNIIFRTIPSSNLIQIQPAMSSGQSTQGSSTSNLHTISQTNTQPLAVNAVHPQIIAAGQPQVVNTGQPQVVNVGQPQVINAGQPQVVNAGQPQVVNTGQPQMVNTGQQPLVNVTQAGANINWQQLINSQAASQLGILNPAGLQFGSQGTPVTLNISGQNVSIQQLTNVNSGHLGLQGLQIRPNGQLILQQQPVASQAQHQNSSNVQSDLLLQAVPQQHQSILSQHVTMPQQQIVPSQEQHATQPFSQVIGSQAIQTKSVGNAKILQQVSISNSIFSGGNVVQQSVGQHPQIVGKVEGQGNSPQQLVRTLQNIQIPISQLPASTATGSVASSSSTTHCTLVTTTLSQSVVQLPSRVTVANSALGAGGQMSSVGPILTSASAGKVNTVQLTSNELQQNLNIQDLKQLVARKNLTPAQMELLQKHLIGQRQNTQQGHNTAKVNVNHPIIIPANSSSPTLTAIPSGQVAMPQIAQPQVARTFIASQQNVVTQKSSPQISLPFTIKAITTTQSSAPFNIAVTLSQAATFRMSQPVVTCVTHQLSSLLQQTHTAIKSTTAIIAQTTATPSLNLLACSSVIAKPIVAPPPGKLPIPSSHPVLTQVKIADQVLNLNLTVQQKEKLQLQLSKLTHEQQVLFLRHQNRLLQKLQQQQHLQQQIQAQVDHSRTLKTDGSTPIVVNPVITPENASNIINRGVKRPGVIEGPKIPLIHQQLCKDQAHGLKSDTKTPFSNHREACRRLLRYHVFQSPEPSGEDLKKVDDVVETISRELIRKSHMMFEKYRSLLLDESMRQKPSAEMVMIDRMLNQDFTACISREKKIAKEDPLSFEVMPMKLLKQSGDVSSSKHTATDDSECMNSSTDLAGDDQLSLDDSRLNSSIDVSSSSDHLDQIPSQTSAEIPSKPVRLVIRNNGLKFTSSLTSNKQHGEPTGTVIKTEPQDSDVSVNIKSEPVFSGFVDCSMKQENIVASTELLKLEALQDYPSADDSYCNMVKADKLDSPLTGPMDSSLLKGIEDISDESMTMETEGFQYNVNSECHSAVTGLGLPSHSDDLVSQFPFMFKKDCTNGKNSPFIDVENGELINHSSKLENHDPYDFDSEQDNHSSLCDRVADKEEHLNVPCPNDISGNLSDHVSLFGTVDHGQNIDMPSEEHSNAVNSIMMMQETNDRYHSMSSGVSLKNYNSDSAMIPTKPTDLDAGIGDADLSPASLSYFDNQTLGENFMVDDQADVGSNNILHEQMESAINSILSLNQDADHGFERIPFHNQPDSFSQHEQSDYNLSSPAGPDESMEMPEVDHESISSDDEDRTSMVDDLDAAVNSILM